MPVVIRHGALKLFFYSNEGNPREPMHIHARAAGKEAKIWLANPATVAKSNGFSARELRAILELIAERRSEIEEAWNEHFGN
ncbi:MAG: DUF4160 domain-containing protein [Pararhizobium sp.]